MKKIGVAAAIIAIHLAAGISTVYAQDGSQDRIREQLRLRIDQSEQLTNQERQQMRNNLRELERLGVPPEDLDAIFPGADQATGPKAQAMLRIQNRVMTMAQEGLPADAVTSKFREGLLKNVPDGALDQACERMESNVRAAQRVMEQVRGIGNEPPVDAGQERRMTRELAQQMWRGMGEGDYERVCEQARSRLRDGSCDVADVVAAGEVAARLRERGVERDRALEVSGDALRAGYRAGEMRHLQFIVTAQERKGTMDAFVTDLEQCLGLGMGTGEMYRHMMQNGWMGPGDVSGPGGFQPGDRGNGPGHGGTQRDGMGGGSGDPGGDGPGGGGNGNGGGGGHGGSGTNG